MSTADAFDQAQRKKDRVIQPKHDKPYSLRVPVDKSAEASSEEEEEKEANNEEDTLRVMPPEIGSKPPMQPLSLPEKKILYDFWNRQWEAFKAAPACQNVPEKRLREKFDSYISINIRRYLLKDWNNMFAGGFVLGEPEPREERESDDLRALTKRWGWLCKELGFKPWPNAVDDQNENLENVKVDVRNEPFGITDKEVRGSHTTGEDANEQGGVMLNAQVISATRALHGVQNQIPRELINVNVRLMEAAQSHFHEMKAAHESEVVNKEGIMRNDPRFDVRVFACMMDELRDMEEQGLLSSDVARVVRALVIQDISY